MSVALTPLTDADLALVEVWLQAPHVRPWWGDPRTILAELVSGGGHPNRALIVAEGCPVGLVLWGHPTRAELDEAGLTDVPTDVIDVDIMIGEEDARGAGLGPAAIALVVQAAFRDPAVPSVIAATMVDNAASRRAFEKAGFAVDREFDDVESGRCFLLRRSR